MLDKRHRMTVSQCPLQFNSGHSCPANGVYIADELAGVRFPNSLNNPNSGLIRFINTSGAPVTFYPGAPPAQRITVNPGEIKVIAGLRTGPGVNPSDIGDNGPALNAVIFPADVAVDVAGNMYIADYEATRTNRVRRIDAGTGTVTTLYGDGSPTFVSRPTGIAIDGTGRVVVADTFNNRILRQNTAGSSEFSIIANEAMLVNRPRDVAVAPDGTIVVTSTANARILRITAPGNGLGTAVVLGGTGAVGFSGDGGPATAAQIALDNQPQNDIHQETVGIAVAPNGAVLFADTNNARIRQILDAPPDLQGFSPASPQPLLLLRVRRWQGIRLSRDLGLTLLPSSPSPIRSHFPQSFSERLSSFGIVRRPHICHLRSLLSRQRRSTI